jgi:SAM-dependent methyltransferase
MAIRIVHPVAAGAVIPNACIVPRAMTTWPPRWQPLSAVLLDVAGAYLSPAIARHLLATRGAIVVRFVGDRLWPAVPWGTRLQVAPIPDGQLTRGTLVLALVDDIPDLLRVDADQGAAVRLRADADPALRVEVARSQLLGIADSPARFVSTLGAWRRRTQLDLYEALHHTSDQALDAAETVRDKYDAQAPFYDDSASSSVRPELRAAIERHANSGTLLVVAGCGAGAECRELASAGFRVLGIDFSEEMIRRARAASSAFDTIEYRRADLRHPGLAPSSCAAVLFTPDVYSFIPDRADRVHTLQQLSQSLVEGGALFVSARVASHFWTRAMLSLQWCASRADRARGWGSSHTRWVGGDGGMRRSFIRLFSERQLESEFGEAGLVPAEFVTGWYVLQSV